MSRQRVGCLLRNLLARAGRGGTLGALAESPGPALIAAARQLSQLRGPRVPCWPAVPQLRSFSEGLHTGLLSELSESEYNTLADSTLEDMLERIEAYVEDLDIDGDVEYSQGVMTIRLGPLGTYVINKQTPNRQIWMSSPVSGPVRYDYMQGQWVYHRDGHSMKRRLEQELQGLTGTELHLGPV